MSRARAAEGLAGIAAASLLVYANALPNDFVWDDVAVVRDSAFIRDPSNLKASFLLMAERFLYLASAGWALLLARGAERLSPRFATWPAGRAAPAIALVVTVALVYTPRTILRNRDWRDSVVFFTRMVEQTPDLIGARLNLSGALRERGRYAEAAAQLRVATALGYRPWMTPGVAPDPPPARTGAPGR